MPQWQSDDDDMTPATDAAMAGGLVLLAGAGAAGAARCHMHDISKSNMALAQHIISAHSISTTDGLRVCERGRR